MQTLTLAEKKIPRKDLVTGIGASFMVHILVFSAAFIGAWIMPPKSLKPPFCTVNLVSLQDIGLGSMEPKGSPKAPDETLVSERVKSSGKAAGASERVTPIKRLQVDDTVKKSEVQIKKIEPKEVPKTPEKPQSLDAIEKNLDKLISKPKAVPKTAEPVAEQPEPPAKAAAQAAPAAPAGGPAKSESGGGKVARGTPNGAAEGGARGTTHGSTSGSPDGTTAANQLASMYGEQIRQRIQQQWRLVNDQGVGGLKAVLEVQIRKTGEIVNIKVMTRSGNELFDEAAVRAVNKAAPLPPVPEAIVQASTKLILTFLPGRVS